MNSGEYILILLLTTVSVFTFVGNGLVFTAIWHEKRLQKRSNIFIINLAIADFTVSVFNIPLTIASMVSQDWRSSNQICNVSGFFEVLFLVVSVQTLGQIALNRYFYVVWWKQYKKIMTYVRTVCIIALLWVFSILLCLPPLFGWSKYGYKKNMAHCFVIWGDNLSYAIFMVLTCFFCPLFLMVWCYIQIFRMNKAREIEKRRWLRQELGGKSLSLAGFSSRNTIKSNINLCSSSISIRPHKYEEQENVARKDTRPYSAEGVSSYRISETELDSRRRTYSFTESSLRYHSKIEARRYSSPFVENSSQKRLGGSLPTSPDRYHQQEKKRTLSSMQPLPSQRSLSTSLGSSYRNIRRKQKNSVSERFFAITNSIYSTGNRGTSCKQVNTCFPRISKHENKVTLMMVFMVAVFFISWLPFVVLMFLEIYSIEVPRIFEQSVLLVGYSNSLYNPIIYGVMNTRFRKVYKTLFQNLKDFRK